jgi:hypothetical protein
MTSQQILNAQRELERRRNQAGVVYRASIPTVGDVAAPAWTAPAPAPETPPAPPRLIQIAIEHDGRYVMAMVPEEDEACPDGYKTAHAMVPGRTRLAWGKWVKADPTSPFERALFRRVFVPIAAPAPAPETPTETPTETPETRTVRIYQSIALAALQRNLAPAMRAYLLLRDLDRAGAGMIPAADLRAALADIGLTWRRGRQILRAGEGIFWTRDKRNRLFLHGPHRIAAALELERLTGQPALVDYSALAAGIAETKAAFLAAFHTGRDANPVTRATVRRLTGIPESTQRHYERIAEIDKRANYALEEGDAPTGPAGRTFTYVDWVGNVGEQGAKYRAETLPNTFLSPLQRARTGRQRKANQRLALVKSKEPGNDSERRERLYYHDAGKMGKAFNRDPHTDRYLSIGKGLDVAADRLTRLRGVSFWHPLRA